MLVSTTPLPVLRPLDLNNDHDSDETIGKHTACKSHLNTFLDDHDRAQVSRYGPAQTQPSELLSTGQKHSSARIVASNRGTPPTQIKRISNSQVGQVRSTTSSLSPKPSGPSSTPIATAPTKHSAKASSRANRPVQNSIQSFSPSIGRAQSAQQQIDHLLLLRQRDNLLMRSQHLQQLLREAECTVTKQAKEIQVLRHAVSDSNPFDSNTHPFRYNVDNTNDTIGDISDGFNTIEAHRTISDLLVTVATLRSELTATKEQLAIEQHATSHAMINRVCCPSCGVWFQVGQSENTCISNQKDTAASTASTMPSRPYVSTRSGLEAKRSHVHMLNQVDQNDEIIEIEMPSLVMSGIRNRAEGLINSTGKNTINGTHCSLPSSTTSTHYNTGLVRIGTFNQGDDADSRHLECNHPTSPNSRNRGGNEFDDSQCISMIGSLLDDTHLMESTAEESFSQPPRADFTNGLENIDRIYQSPSKEILVETFHSGSGSGSGSPTRKQPVRYHMDAHSPRHTKSDAFQEQFIGIKTASQMLIPEPSIPYASAPPISSRLLSPIPTVSATGKASSLTSTKAVLPYPQSQSHLGLQMISPAQHSKGSSNPTRYLQPHEPTPVWVDGALTSKKTSTWISSIDKQLIIKERDALEEELLLRYMQLRKMEQRYTAELEQRDRELEAIKLKTAIDASGKSTNVRFSLAPRTSTPE
ncbi:hypothetical protein BDV3_004823 [Batrachochytrium dendrobatidis]